MALHAKRVLSIHQAVQQFGNPSIYEMADADPDMRSLGSSSILVGSPGVWARIHTIYYRPAQMHSSVSGDPASLASSVGSSQSRTGKSEAGKKGKGSSKQSKRKATDELWNEGTTPFRNNPLQPYLVNKLVGCPNLQDPSLEVLCLLRALHALNRYWGTMYSLDFFHPVIANQEFINSKLTAKVCFNF